MVRWGSGAAILPCESVAATDSVGDSGIVPATVSRTIPATYRSGGERLPKRHNKVSATHCRDRAGTSLRHGDEGLLKPHNERLLVIVQRWFHDKVPRIGRHGFVMEEGSDAFQKRPKHECLSRVFSSFAFFISESPFHEFNHADCVSLMGTLPNEISGDGRCSSSMRCKSIVSDAKRCGLRFATGASTVVQALNSRQRLGSEP